MTPPHFFAKLRQAQYYNARVAQVLISRLQTRSGFSRTANFTLWTLFQTARVVRNLRSRLRSGSLVVQPTASAVPWSKPLSQASRATFGNRVLIIAELSLLQCKKYRVDQKAELLSLLGMESTILPWHDHQACRNALQTHGMVIFYRTPAFPTVEQLARESRRLGLVSFFDIDDLIFDSGEYARNTNVQRLPKEERDLLISGSRLYRRMFDLTDHAIASTPTIAGHMRPLCKGKVFVLENCLDTHLLDLAADSRPPPGTDVIIGYGSGTKTHDADFMEVADALCRILDSYPQVRLAIYGHLELPQSFTRYESRIVRVPFLAPDDYYLSLARFSINLAPLEETVFNDAKSNIKFLEAALFGVPSVCSPTVPFRQVIRHGENGFLARSPEEWFAALSRLVEDAELRRQVGATARQDALEFYAPAAVAPCQLEPVTACGLPPARKNKLRILEVNVLFAPMSFGGATIVAEQLAAELAAMPDVEVCVFTGCFPPQLPPCELARYEWNGMPVIAIGLPVSAGRDADYDNPEMAARFEEVLRAVRPDVVHFHSVQMLSAALADACLRTGIPYVITLHDAWWLCERQFMVREDGKYCAQAGVDVMACAACVPDPAFSHRRFHRLWRIMADAALLLTPSKFQRELYIRSGIPPQHIRVNKNGVLAPGKMRRPGSDGHVTFAFLGGRATHKGYFWLREVFAGIAESNYTLRLVDVEGRFGTSLMAGDAWRIAGKLEIVPPFEQCDLDDFYSEIDVLLFPSQWKESFGLTVREAMIRNIWVISTDCGGPVEDITRGENGDIVGMEGVDEFRTAIRALLRNPAQLFAYRNPYPECIRHFPEQACELVDYLRNVANAGNVTA